MKTPRHVHVYLLLITSLALSACAINTSPLHTKLSYKEFDRRVAKRFSYGMSYNAVFEKCRSASLEIPNPAKNPKNVKCPVPPLCARVEPPGVYSTTGLATLFNGNAIYGGLVFCFDSEGKLNQVQYHDAPIAGSKAFTPSHRVPLERYNP